MNGFDKTAVVNKAQVLADKLVDMYPDLQAVQLRIMDQLLEQAFGVLEKGDRRRNDRRSHV